MRQSLALFLIMLFLPVAAAAPVVRGTVGHVSDGDTLTVCGTGIEALRACVPVRVKGINAAEKRLCKAGDAVMAACEPCRRGAQMGVLAAAEAKRRFPPGSPVELLITGRDRDRYVAEVRGGGKDWATTMIDAGLAVPYPCRNGRCGKRPRPWCPM
jgi:endonuclease YncB( thermonuclease family)